MTHIDAVVSLAGNLAGALTVPGTLELGLLTAAGWLPPRRRSSRRAANEQRAASLAVVVPAHNEQDSIQGCIASLQKCRPPKGQARIFVVADNCTDATAERARAAGAEVMERHDDARRGKGHALDFAFSRLLPEGFDAFLIVDADSEVDPGLLRSVSDAIAEGAGVVQCAYLAAQPERSPLLDLALRGFNLVRPRGRDRLGWSCGIYGNGFAISRRVLEAVPYTAASIVEDLEYHLQLVQAGYRAEFVQDSAVRGAMPVNAAGRASQRARWEGGRLGILRSHGVALASGVVRGRLNLAGPLLELLTLPLAFHSLLLAAAVAQPSAFGRMAGVAGFVALALHLAAAVAAGKCVGRDLRTLAAVPAYLVWKLAQAPRIFQAAGRGAAWIRTERAAGETSNA